MTTDVFDEIPEPELTPPPSERDAGAAAEERRQGFGSVIALRDISLHVDPGTVTCVLGDNGAGKSTLIKILSGVHQPSEGEFLVNGEPTSFSSPRDALGAGIATVFQDLATVPLMSVWRNFFLGNEPREGSRAVAVPRHRQGQTRLPRGAAGDGHRPPRPGAAGRHAVRR